MGASCGRRLPYDEVGHYGEEAPFITLKSRDPESLQKTLERANMILDQRDWVVKSAVPLLYTVGDAIGKGATGSVRTATRKSDGLQCAVKTVPKMLLPNLKDFLTEVEILRKLDHPNIVKCLDTLDDGICCHAILEKCGGGDLFDWFLSLPRYTEETIASLMADIAGAISHCHHHCVVHRDLKPENILLHRPVKSGEKAIVKLCDFGSAYLLDAGAGVAVASEATLRDPQMDSLAGSSYYIAPEVLQQDNRYTSVVDVWSIGVIAYLLLSGYPPFDGDTEADIQLAVLRAQYSFEPRRRARTHVRGFSALAKDFISKCLQPDPEERMTAAEAQQHAWVTATSRATTAPKTTTTGRMTSVSKVGYRRESGTTGGWNEDDDESNDQSNNDRHHVHDASGGGDGDGGGGGAAAEDDGSDVAERIKDFAALPQVKRTILAALAKQLTEDQAEAQTKYFRDIDDDNDGALGLSEMKTAGVDTPTANKLGDHISFSEYLAATTDVSFNDDMLRRFFDRFDVDGTGYISLLDVEQRLHEKSQAMSVRRRSLQGTAVSPQAAQRKLIDFPAFRRFLRSNSQRISRELSPHGQLHNMDVVVEVYPDDPGNRRSASPPRLRTHQGRPVNTGARSVVQLGSPPRRRLHKRKGGARVQRTMHEL